MFSPLQVKRFLNGRFTTYCRKVGDRIEELDARQCYVHVERTGRGGLQIAFYSSERSTRYVLRIKGEGRLNISGKEE